MVLWFIHAGSLCYLPRSETILDRDYRVRARNAWSRVTPDNQNSTHTSTRYTSTTIAPINNALAAIKALKLEEKLIY
jgi:hypothetical protein